MLFAHYNNKKYPVAEMSSEYVELISFVPEPDFIKVRTNLYSKTISINETSDINKITTYYNINNEEYLFLGEFNNSCLLVSPSGETIELDKSYLSSLKPIIKIS